MLFLKSVEPTCLNPTDMRVGFIQIKVWTDRLRRQLGKSMPSCKVSIEELKAKGKWMDSKDLLDYVTSLMVAAKEAVALRGWGEVRPPCTAIPPAGTPGMLCVPGHSASPGAHLAFCSCCPC